MSSALMSLLISHILTYAESELAKEEPQLVQDVINDINSMINKLEKLIAAKNVKIASVVNPALDDVKSVVDTAISAGANAAINTIGKSNIGNPGSGQ